MRRRRLFISIAVALWLTGAQGTARADSFTFETLPADGAISGLAESTIGWGYVLTNISLTEWLVATAISADVFQFATPNASLFDLPMLAPGTSIAAPYLAATAGLFEITWDPGAPMGLLNSGLFTFSGEWWSGDPLIDGEFLRLAVDQSVAYSATMTAPPSPVPEPSSLVLLMTGGAACWRALRKRRA